MHKMRLLTLPAFCAHRHKYPSPVPLHTVGIPERIGIHRTCETGPKALRYSGVRIAAFVFISQSLTPSPPSLVLDQVHTWDWINTYPRWPNIFRLMRNRARRRPSYGRGEC